MTCPIEGMKLNCLKCQNTKEAKQNHCRVAGVKGCRRKAPRKHLPYFTCMSTVCVHILHELNMCWVVQHI